MSTKKHFSDLEKANKLAEAYLKLQAEKRVIDEQMREKLEEIHLLAIKHQSAWFTDATGKTTKTAAIDSGKLVWKTPSPVYKFASTATATDIKKFAQDFPNSIEYKLKNMKNILFADYSIEVQEFEPKIAVEPN